jgi:aspartate-semialdehyde dehydrogenase
MKKYNIVILGATGAVGIEFRKILLQRNFPINNVSFLGKTTVGKTIDFSDKKVTC